jgi:pyruvate carboxylase
MDQRLEDIDPDARKKYDRDMKQYAKEMEANEKKANASAQKAGYPSAEAEEKALRQKAIEELTNKKGTNLNKEAARGGGGGGSGIPKLNRDLTKNMKSGGKVSSASKRADGCAIRGKTRA